MLSDKQPKTSVNIIQDDENREIASFEKLDYQMSAFLFEEWLEWWSDYQNSWG